MLKKSLAVVGTAAVALTGFSLASAPAFADGAKGEVRGYLWPGGDGNPNWEGTYRMPDGQEAWCASIWAPEPFYADSYVDGGILTKNDGSPMPQTGDRSLEQLAYIISEASEKVIEQVGKEADDYASAVSVIVHDWTNSDPAVYAPDWPKSNFENGTDPLGTGQNPRDVPVLIDQLISDAQKYSGQWNLDLAADQLEVEVGDTVTLTGELTRVTDSAPISNKNIQLQISGGSGPETVTTNAQGEFEFVATVEAEQMVVEASRISPADTVTMEIPVTWRGDDRPQNMIVVNDHQVTAKVSVAGKLVTLGTSASDQSDGDKSIYWNGGTVVDVVSYTGLTPGQEYTVKGELMDQATGEGTGIFGETVFSAEEAEGAVEVLFEVPAGFAGSTLVVFERLYNAAGELQAVHEDLEDEGQTVVVEEQPTLRTLATNKETGEKTLPSDGGTILDTVTYTGLTPGQEYILTGELMDKSTGLSTGLKGKTTFTPEEADGKALVEFKVPNGYSGKSLVVFEKLYDVEGEFIAEHTDINSEEQTVRVEKEKVGLAYTGGSFPALLGAGGALLLLAGLAFTATRRKRLG